MSRGGNYIGKGWGKGKEGKWGRTRARRREGRREGGVMPRRSEWRREGEGSWGA